MTGVSATIYGQERICRTAVVVVLGISLLLMFSSWTVDDSGRGTWSLQEDDDLDDDATSEDDGRESPARAEFLESIRSVLPEFVARDMDFTIDPCDNFYEYVCGGWVENATIPGHLGSFDRSFDAAALRVKIFQRDAYQAEFPSDSEFQLLHRWYASCMDTEGIEAAGTAPLQTILSVIDSIDSLSSIQDTFLFLMSYNIPTFLSIDVAISAANHSFYVLAIKPGGITLHSADGWPTDPPPHFADLHIPTNIFPPPTNTTSSSSMLDRNLSSGCLPDTYDCAQQLEDRAAVLSYYASLLSLATGADPPAAARAAANAVWIESCLMRWKRAAKPNRRRVYTLSQVEELSPNIPWRRFLQDISDGCTAHGASCAETLLGEGQARALPSAPEYLEWVSVALGVLPAEAWKDFLRARAVHDAQPLLPERFLLANLEFKKAISQVEELPPRWEKCVRATEGGLPALAQLHFLAYRFPNDARKEGWDMLGRLKDSFIDAIGGAEWLDNVTRARALVKAQRMEMNLGSQAGLEGWWRYDVTDSYFNNSQAAYRLHLLRSFTRLDRPVNRSDWTMRATAVNAYYDNGVNGMFIPAGIMQPPFFNDTFRVEQNYGGIGSIMGHEMTHGFDNTGRKFNEDREMVGWWDQEGFRIADTSVDGRQTLGENIADFGGLKVAVSAFRRWHTAEYGVDPPAEKLRLLFVSFGQLWCDRKRYKDQQRSVGTDVHSPNPFRTNGVVSQSADFGGLFQV